MLLLWLLSAVALSLADPCPPGAVYNDNLNICYMYFPEPRPFANAQSNCVSMGGSLTEIQSAFENTLVWDFAKVKLNGSDLWLGGSVIQGQWRWIDWSVLNYAKWMKGHPVNSPSLQCVAMQMSDGTWIDSDCGASKSYVCTLPSSIDPDHTWPPAPTGGPCKAKCDDGWSYADVTNFCYKLMGSATFNAGEAMCNQHNAHLASVHNAFEYRYVYAQGGIHGWDWLLTSIHYMDGVWVNTDGTPVDYGWDTNQTPPDADHTTVVYYGLLWEIYTGASSATDTDAVVCKKPPNY